MSAALVDAGPLIAALDEDDPHHAAAAAALGEVRGELLTAWPALSEAHYILQRRDPGLADNLLKAFAAEAFRVVTLESADIPPIAEVLKKYRDQRLQLADAALLHLSARDGIETIVTLDERDFRAVAAARKGRLKVVVCRKKP